MFTRCDDTVSMTANALWPSRPNEKWQHRLSSRTPTGTEPASPQLIRVRIETRWRATCGATNNSKSKDPIKRKQNTDLDTSDLLIESAFSSIYGAAVQRRS